MNHRKQEEEELEMMLFQQNSIITNLIAIISKLTDAKNPPPQKQNVLQVLVTNINNQNFIIMNPLSLVLGFLAAIMAQLVDAKTLVAIAGATFVPKSAATDNPAIATVDAKGNLVAVAVGQCNLTVVNTWTYTDASTGQQVVADQQTVIGVTVTAAAEGVQQIITLGPAVAIGSVAAAVAGARHIGPAR